MRRYVTGFMFDSKITRVALIEKNRPDWQAGKLNGIGGKVEPGEEAAAAMRREFWEEADLDYSKWEHRFKLHRPEAIQSVPPSDGPNTSNNVPFELDVYRAITDDIFKIKTGSQSKTDEMVWIINLEDLKYSVTVPNIAWMIPLVLDTGFQTANILY